MRPQYVQHFDEILDGKTGFALDQDQIKEAVAKLNSYTELKQQRDERHAEVLRLETKLLVANEELAEARAQVTDLLAVVKALARGKHYSEYWQDKAQAAVARAEKES